MRSAVACASHERGRHEKEAPARESSSPEEKGTDGKIMRRMERECDGWEMEGGGWKGKGTDGKVMGRM